MDRIRQGLAALALLFPLTALQGCGDGGTTVSEAKLSPEATKADQAAQDAVRDMMQSKGKGPKKAAAPTGVAPK